MMRVVFEGYIKWGIRRPRVSTNTVRQQNAAKTPPVGDGKFETGVSQHGCRGRSGLWGHYSPKVLC